MTKRPRLYFSFRSPYSWMALHRLQQALPDVHERFEWLPYFAPDETTQSVLDARGIEMHYTAMSKAKHLYILQDVKRLTARMGLSMRWPIDIDPWWVLPHHAYFAARRAGAGLEFYNAMCAAR
ncbi:DsbA family protein, partial [Motilibacter deserti]|nr:disulfide bond formation protein DsbA [Motilibacter deserti]